jgi:hypothetical protein
MRSSIAIAVAVAVAALGCTDPVMKPLDASNDAAACGCHLEGSGLSAVLVMSFSCYCAAYGDGCTGELAATCADFRQRFDYPACGLTDVRGVPAIVPSDYVFDQDGKLVGARIASDTSFYKCPSDPSLTAGVLQAGRLPEASCAEVACGTCTTAPFPCSPGADGGAGQ